MVPYLSLTWPSPSCWRTFSSSLRRRSRLGCVEKMFAERLAVQLHRRREEEGVKRLGLAQVLVGICDMEPLTFCSADIRAAGLPGEQRAAAVRGELAVPRQHPDQQEADRVDQRGDQHDQRDQQGRLAVVVTAHAAAAAEQLGVEREPHEQARYDRQQARVRHHLDVLVRHVAQLVREHALELVVVQPALDALGHAEHGVLAVAPGREGVRQVGGGDRHPGLVHVRERAQPVHDRVQLRLLLRGDLAGARGGQRDLVAVEERDERRAAAEDQRHDDDRSRARVRGAHQADDQRNERDENQAEEEHRRRHPHGQAPVGRVSRPRRHNAPPLQPGPRHVGVRRVVPGCQWQSISVTLSPSGGFPGARSRLGPLGAQARSISIYP